MKRGEVWTVAAGPDFAGKPRPAVVVQDEQFDSTMSVTVCLLTSTLRNADMLRVPVEPTDSNGLAQVSQVMVDKITTVPLAKVGEHLGELSMEDMAAIDRVLLVFLALTRTVTEP